MTIPLKLIELASISKDETEIKGISFAKHKPFAAETPILNPVYEPGPLLTEIQDNSCDLNLFFFKIFRIKLCRFSEWEYKLLSISIISIKSSPFDKETEQFDVEVSIFNIKSNFKFLGEYQNKTLKP